MGEPTRQMTGRQLLGWIRSQCYSERVLRRAERLGEARRYPGLIREWSPDQVADVFHELTAKPARGASPWGGSRSAGSGQVPDSKPVGPVNRTK